MTLKLLVVGGKSLNKGFMESWNNSFKMAGLFRNELPVFMIHSKTY